MFMMDSYSNLSTSPANSDIAKLLKLYIMQIHMDEFCSATSQK